MMPRLRVADRFDSGAIELVGIDGDRIDVNIRADLVSDPSVNFRQWFHFRLHGCGGRSLTIRFLNAGDCTYVDGWTDYRVCASVDTEHWYRIETSFDGRVMTAHCTASADTLHLAYFEPYPWQRHQALIGRSARDPRVRIEDLGTTLDGHDLDSVVIGNPQGKPVWIIARQHPGETMAEWYVEGLIEALLDPADSLSRALLERTCFHLVPNMNPDGSARGNLRTNAAGANLNREWSEPTRDRSPEVCAVRSRMRQTGCALFLDIHGDEALPYVFVAGSETLPSYTERHARLQALFCERFMLAAPDFQVAHGYPVGKYTTDALKLASKWAGNEFDCLSLTLEMPFKDNADLPDPASGWSARRSKVLGAASRVAMRAVLDAG